VDVPEGVTTRNWSRFFDPGVPMFYRPAERDGKVVSFAISTLHPSAWTSSIATLRTSSSTRMRVAWALAEP